MIKNKILDNVARYDSERFTTAFGIITRYYDMSNTADVSVATKGTNNLVLENIPLPFSGRGIHLMNPQIGDKVIVAFVNSSALQGKVIAYVDDEYEYKSNQYIRNLESGSFNSNIDFENLEVKEVKKPLCNCWIDNENKSEFKYYLYQKRSPIQELIYDVSLLGKMNSNDIGFLHLNNKSTVKIKENGSIEIYTKDNKGLKIDPNTSTITIESDKSNQSFNNWKLKSSIVEFECDEFNVKSNKIKLDANEFEIQSEEKNFTIDDIVKEI